MINFKPKQIANKLLSVLSERARDVLEKRYGLGADGENYTLESIGQKYGITRERVRQIENYAIQSIQKSDVYEEHQDLFEELRTTLLDLGAVISEKILLEELATTESTKKYLYFLLVVGAPFYKNKENTSFTHRWYVEKKVSDTVETALQKIYKSIDSDELISEKEILKRLRNELGSLDSKYNNDDSMLRRWLNLSKEISKNPLGEWGLSSSPNVNAKGIRDYAYLAVKRHGSPMHFREVAETIENLFERQAHVATCHNELIKDERFVLVGRGLYALTEWGYSAGVVKDVLRDILQENGPLSKEEIIDKVRKERYVKDNTIVVNLQDTHIFKKLANGAYSLVV